jgi:hypothetical protein
MFEIKFGGDKEDHPRYSYYSSRVEIGRPVGIEQKI